MFAWMIGVEGWIALGTLAALEIVLGIDNIIFISILVGRLPAAKRDLARNVDFYCDVYASGPSVFYRLVVRLTNPVFRSRHRYFGSRYYPDRRRSFPDGKGNP